MIESLAGPTSPARPRRRRALDLLPVLALAAALGAAHAAGVSGRRIADPPAVIAVEGREHAAAVFARAGVRGRILVHLDRRIAMAVGADEDGRALAPAAGPTTDENVIYRALRQNLVRRVYHVVPRSAWAEVEAHLRGRPDAIRDGETFRLTALGAPLIVSTLDRLPDLGEPALVTVDAGIWSEAELDAIRARLADGALRADLVVVYGRGADALARTLSEAHALR